MSADLDALRSFVRTHCPGGCRVLSDAACGCHLCTIDLLAARAESAERARDEALERLARVADVVNHRPIPSYMKGSSQEWNENYAVVDRVHVVAILRDVRAALAKPTEAP